MNPNLIAGTFIGLTITGITALNIADIRRRARAEREEIRRQARLDILAIENAHVVIKQRIRSGEIRNLAQLGQATVEEIEFAKIAIRES